MFASLKNKIKEETGSDISTAGSQRGGQNNNRIRSRYSSTFSVNSNLDDSVSGTVVDGSQAFEQVQKLRGQINELSSKVADLTQRLQQLQEEKGHVEKTNEILLESVRVAQTQKDLMCEEGEKIQNLQHAEIEKLKTLLNLREQEAQERLNMLRQNQQQIENLTSELERLKPMEPVMDDLQELHVQENKELKRRLQAAEERFNEYDANAEQATQSLRSQIASLQQELLDTQNKLEQEREEKLTALLRNAEISQSEELLRKELRTERDDANELHEKNEQLKQTLRTQQHETQQTHTTVNELRAELALHTEKLHSVEELEHELNEKNKTIRVLNQRVADLKKTLQQELRSAQVHDVCTLPTVLENGHYTATMSKTLPTHASCSNCSAAFSDVNIANNSLGSGSGSIVMDEVNFKYLKHVIVKFLTSREVEARHLIRAVATLLKLTPDEEKLLHDTLNWKMSWFGSKPDVGSGQHAFAIPPS